MKGGVIFSGVGQRRMSILFLIAGALISAVIWLRWEAPRRPRHDVAFFHPFWYVRACVVRSGAGC